MQDLKGKNVRLFSDRKLVINHIKGEIEAKGDQNIKYLDKVTESIKDFV